MCSCLHIVFGYNCLGLLDLTYDMKNLKFYLIFFVVFIGMIGPVHSHYSNGNEREDNLFMMFVKEGHVIIAGGGIM